MKIFDSRFISGTLLTGVGTVGVIAGIFSFLPPTSNALLGVLLIVVCLPLAVIGYKFAKNTPPNSARTGVKTLRKAGLIDKKK